MADTILPKNAFEPIKEDLSQQQEQINKPSLTFFQDAMRRLKQNKIAVVSLFVLMIISLAALFAPVLAPQNPNTQNVAYANLPPKIGKGNLIGFTGEANVGGIKEDKYTKAKVPAGTTFILGTDYLGRDLLSRILYGTRLSLLIALLATLIDLMIGIPYGIVSGWLGGRIDTFMQRVIEVLSSIPNLIVVVLMMLILKPGLSSIVVALGFTGWITMARLIRAQTYKLKEQEFVLAARTLGESSFNIAKKHLIPNLASTIIIQTMFTIPSAIFFEAFLSFIGIGIPAPNASLGTLLADGQKAFRFLPYQMWYPAIVLSLIMIAINLLADGLRDAFDPKS